MRLLCELVDNGLYPSGPREINLKNLSVCLMTEH